MASRKETLTLELQGGLINNLSRIQHGIKAPGSARTLTNFEPSIKGGYRRINGVSKYSSSIVPAYGDPRVQASGQTGTTLNIANIYVAPVEGDTFTISGVTGTYTIDSGGVSYNSTEKSATLTLTTSLDSSPADQAAITFTTGPNRIEGLVLFEGEAYAVRDGILWKGSGTTWSKVNTPSYGTVLVNGGSQTGTSLVVDGIGNDDYPPQIGDTFTVNGIEKVYTVTAAVTSSSGAATMTISPSLASSPADNAALTFLNTNLGGATKVRKAEFNFDGNITMVLVLGSTLNPISITSSGTFTTVVGSSDVTGASHVAEFKDHILYAKDDLVTFTEPFLFGGFNTGSGAGSFRMPGTVTGMIVFRETLFVFTRERIKQLNGTSVSDFTLTDVSKEIGCVQEDTIQEVGGDVLFLGPDGVRFLGATDRIGDFAIANASRQIQKLMNDFADGHTDFCSVLVREKGQYRIFGANDNEVVESATGYIGVQFGDQKGNTFEWSTLKGIKAYRADSEYYNGDEIFVHCNDITPDYVYSMESGNSLDGSDIAAYFYTPYIPLVDPEKRKTHYHLTMYADPEGAISGTLSPRLNFNKSGVPQPSSKSISGTGGAGIYGVAVYGSGAVYGAPSTAVIRIPIEGSFDNVSYEFEFIGQNPPFNIDTFTVEFVINGRL